jgi:hypothetical protein
VQRGLGSRARRLVGVGLGAGFCLLLGARPAPALTIAPVTVPSLPPLVVAPGPVTVGPITVDPQASVTPTGATVNVATGGLPLGDGGSAIGIDVGPDGAQVGVGGVDAGVTLPGSTTLTPGTPTIASAPSAGPVAGAPPVPTRESIAEGRFDATAGVARIPASSTADPKTVEIQDSAQTLGATGTIDPPRHRGWWLLAAEAARSYPLWIVLLVAAFVIRSRVGAAWRDQRGVRIARSS